jgi:hypothetical protein
MPFGLDIKSVVLGIILALFVWPWIQSLLNRNSSAQAAA